MTSGDLAFDGRVALVTGAGRGLGREYALELARRRATVILNDLSTTSAGAPDTESSAENVVEEILSAGGAAVANADSVATAEGARRMVGEAVDRFGRLDIVVANAGIVRHDRFASTSDADARAVLQTNLWGVWHVAKAAFEVMEKQAYGRMVLVTSSSALFGLYGSASYAMSKGGVVGLIRVLALEGADVGVRVNGLAPSSRTRMMDQLQPFQRNTRAESVTARVPLPWDPRFVAPLVTYLASEECPSTGEIYSAVGGRFARIVLGVTRGWHGPIDEPANAEAVRDNWAQIQGVTDVFEPRDVWEEIAQVESWYEG